MSDQGDNLIKKGFVALRVYQPLAIPPGSGAHAILKHMVYGTLIHTCKMQAVLSIQYDETREHAPHKIGGTTMETLKRNSSCWSYTLMDCFCHPFGLLITPFPPFVPCKLVCSTHMQKLDKILAIYVMMHNSSSTPFLTHPTPDINPTLPPSPPKKP